MTGTIGELLGAIAGELAAAGFTEPRRQARRLLALGLDLTPAEQLAHSQQPVAPDAGARVRAMLDRLLAHEPLSRIAGRREFWGLDFRLAPETLDPRPETETVVEAVLRRLPDRRAPLRVLDLGTGTGCLLLALLSELPAAHGVGIDIASASVRTACANAAALGFAGRTLFLAGDWGAALSTRFDVVVANPPYIETAALADLPPEVARHDPPRALDGGADGLAAYRAIAADLPRLLTPGAIIAVEVGAGQADAVAAILAASGCAREGVDRDLAGVGRCVVARADARPAAMVPGCVSAAK